MKNRLKVYRAMYDLTQEALARKLGITRQTVLSIEKEKYDPSLELAFKIASLFEVTIEDIFLYQANKDSARLSQAAQQASDGKAAG
jgi:putative transcriptional regulator